MFEKYKELELNYLISKTDLENCIKILEKNLVMSDDEKKKEIDIRKEQFNLAKTSFLEFYRINKQQIIKQVLEENISFSIDIKTSKLEKNNVSTLYKNDEELDKMFNDTKKIIDNLNNSNKITSELYEDIIAFMDNYKKKLREKRDIAIKDNPELLSSNNVSANIISINDKMSEFNNVFFSLSLKIILIDLLIMLIAYFVNGGSLAALIYSLNLSFIIYLLIILLIFYAFEFPFILFLTYRLLFSNSLVEVSQLNSFSQKIIDRSMKFTKIWFLVLAFISVNSFSINVLFLKWFDYLINEFDIDLPYFFVRYIFYPLSYVIPVALVFVIFYLIFGSILKKFVLKHLFFYFANKSYK